MRVIAVSRARYGPPVSNSEGPIVFVHPSDELYGADRMLLEMYDALPAPVRARAEVWLPTDLAHPEHPLCVELESKGATVRHVDLPILRRAYRTPRELARLARRAVALGRAFRARRPALVYCTTSAALIAAPAARAARVPRVVGHVQELWTGSDLVALRPLASACHQLVAISAPVRSQLPGRLAARTTVVLNGTPEPPTLVPLTGRVGPLSYLVASRWNGWKGHRTLLDAWERAGAPGRLVVLGGPPGSGESVDVPALVRGLSRPASVEVVGEVEDTHPWLEEADVVLVPSDEPEPFGLVAIEAFARGRPVVGSSGGGLADIIEHGRTGWLFPPGDAPALADVLRTLTREKVETAAVAARLTYEDRFTAARFALDWISVVGLTR